MNITIKYPLQGWYATGVEYTTESIIVKCCIRKKLKHHCPDCAARMKKRSTTRLRLRDLPLCGTPVVLDLTLPVMFCERCKKSHAIRPSEAHPSRRITWRFMEMISFFHRDSAESLLAKAFKVSESTVRRSVHEVLKRSHLAHPVNLNNRLCLIIDEKYLGKKTGYITCIMDGINGEVLGIEQGKGLEGISSFFKRMTEEQREAVQVVSIDRGNAFQSAVFTYLPNAAITFDPFHIIKNINDAVSKVRCEQWRLADKGNKRYIKNSRFLLLSSKEKLETNTKGKAKLLELLAVNQPINTAYMLKENMRDIYHTHTTMAETADRLRQWVELAASSGLSAFETLARTLQKQLGGILNFFKFGLTSAAIEGLNSRIARISSKMRGIVSPKLLFYKLRELTCPEFPQML